MSESLKRPRATTFWGRFEELVANATERVFGALDRICAALGLSLTPSKWLSPRGPAAPDSRRRAPFVEPTGMGMDMDLDTDSRGSGSAQGDDSDYDPIARQRELDILQARFEARQAAHAARLRAREHDPVSSNGDVDAALDDPQSYSVPFADVELTDEFLDADEKAEADADRANKPEPPSGPPIQAQLDFKDSHKQLYRLTAPYCMPDADLLRDADTNLNYNQAGIEKKKEVLQATLDSFAIDAQVIGATVGPRVILFEIETAAGVKVESVAQVSNNIAMDLQALSLRILAPVPGRPYVGIEAPNERSTMVCLKEAIVEGALNDKSKQIPLALGKSVNGDNVTLDLAKAPHLLIAGATGSGKSVCLNGMIVSMLYRFTPDKLRLILIDPKVVEFSGYAKIPHLIVPIITDVDKVIVALRWVVKEMEVRYRMLAKVHARNLESFNAREYPAEGQFDERGELIPPELPFIVVVIDELADIIMTARQEVETYLCRLAQLSRAVGIHLIVATQRPSVNVITGVIKANFPTRIAFQVSSIFDSRTILDRKGAESLLGQGDMLFTPPGAAEMLRLQSPFISDSEQENVVNFVSGQAEQRFNMDIFNAESEKVSIPGLKDSDGEEEDLISKAIEIVTRDRKASTSYLQRRMRIGYNRAASLMEILEERGIVGPMLGSSARREILVDPEP